MSETKKEKHDTGRATLEGIKEQEAQKAEPEITLTVAECSKFPNLGEYYENIPTVDEAIAIWKQIPPERMNGIPSIGVNIHMPGTESAEDVAKNILSGNRIDLEKLNAISDRKSYTQVA